MNKHLNDMVNALVNGQNDEAKDHLRQYFNQTTANLINNQQNQQNTQSSESEVNN